MNALIGAYLPIANSANLPERAYYSDGYKPQPDPSHPENEPVKLNISTDAQVLLSQTQGEFLASSKPEKKGTADNKKQEKDSSNKTDSKKSSSKELKSEDSGEEATLRELKARDAEVRAHELKHLASAGQYASGGIVYDYQTGPDGRLYAVGGQCKRQYWQCVGRPGSHASEGTDAQDDGNVGRRSIRRGFGGCAGSLPDGKRRHVPNSRRKQKRIRIVG